MSDRSTLTAATAVPVGERRRSRKSRREPPGKVTELLRQFAEGWDEERISIGDMVDALRRRGHGMMMLVFALPTMLPFNPPGVAAVVGIPCAFVALQLLLRRQNVWLPKALRQRSVSREDFRKVVDKSLPAITRIERLLKPRLGFLTETIGEMLIGLSVLIIALLLALPIPFTNIPLGLAIALLSLGLIERDGLVVLLGSAVAIGTAIFIVMFGWQAMTQVVALVTGG